MTFSRLKFEIVRFKVLLHSKWGKQSGNTCRKDNNIDQHYAWTAAIQAEDYKDVALSTH